MICEEIDKLISDYTVGNLSHKTETMVRLHLDACEDCTRELDRLMLIVGAVEGIEAVESPVGLWNGVYNRIAEGDKSRVHNRLRDVFLRPRRVLSLGVGIAALAGMVFFGISVKEPSDQAINPPDPAAIEYVQGHASAAGRDVFADRVSLGFVASMPAGDKTERL